MPPPDDQPRSTKVDPSALDHYRKERGWIDEDLAEKSGVSVRTISRARNGEAILLDSAKRIAGALGISLNILVHGRNYGIDPPVVVEYKRHRRYSVILHLAIPFHEMMDTDTQNEKMALLRKVIGGFSDIDIIMVQDGSTRLSLEMTEADILRLLAAMMDHDLDMLRVTKVSIPDHSWLIIIIALLHYDKGQLRPQDVDERTMSELLQSHTLEQALQLKTRECFICKKID